ncbi:hypothetical protein DM02DRAFT_427630 [Periconia macrospinosa]|uniref:Uncharacterized protein n=1 Tax=Periconia macrospinosa TaxID=97972 RepID=A0A2V1E8A9_9PLEO|nr:hypothetical protein DM02DRAFT_427630 [Periconia macrospinosa]
MIDGKSLLLEGFGELHNTTMHLTPPNPVKEKTKSIWVRPSERLFPLLGAGRPIPNVSPGSDSLQPPPNDNITLPTTSRAPLPTVETPPSATNETTEYAIAPDHPLANHPWWKSRPHLLAVLSSAFPAVTAQSLPHPSQQQEALHMLAQRSQRTYNMLNLRRGCQKQHGGFPNLEWDIFRELTPRFLEGDFKFAQINWHAIGFKDKLRFEEEVDRACEARNQAFIELQERIRELEMKLEDREAAVASLMKNKKEEGYRMLMEMAVEAVEQASREKATFCCAGLKKDSSPVRHDSVWSFSESALGRQQSPVRHDSVWSGSSSEREFMRPQLRGGVQTPRIPPGVTEIPGLCDVALRHDPDAPGSQWRWGNGKGCYGGNSIV